MPTTQIFQHQQIAIMGTACNHVSPDPGIENQNPSPNTTPYKRTIDTDFVQKDKDSPTYQYNPSLTPHKEKAKPSARLTIKLKQEIRKSKLSPGIKTAIVKTKSLEDFQVIRGLGKGTFGRVYLIREKGEDELQVRSSKKIISLESLQFPGQAEESLPLEIADFQGNQFQTEKCIEQEDIYQKALLQSNQPRNDCGKMTLSGKKMENVQQKLKGNRYFALKIINKSLLKSDRAIEQAMSERIILQSVDHPFIIKLHYAFQSKSRLFFIVDLLQGGQLFFLLRKIGKFKEEVARFYAAEILLALEYLHQQSIIYRDLKPENVLLDSEGHIKITDFGLSKFLYSNSSKTYSFCGTAEYIAPEVITGNGYGQEADWFSYGSLLYDMLTGRPPFASKNKKSILRKLLTKPIPIPLYLSTEAKSLLNSLFKVNPAERLGFKQGAAQIKRHKFFEGIDFEALYHKKVKPPISLQLQKKGDEGLAINANGFENWNSWKANIESCEKADHNEMEGFTYGDLSFEFTQTQAAIKNDEILLQ